ncbi:MAG: Hpt domain-containing protein [Sulfurovum sp.]
MYYILNRTNQIIAIDDKLLSLCGLSHIDQLTLKTALGDIKFIASPQDRLILSIHKREIEFDISKTVLSSMLGKLTLVNIVQIDSTTDILKDKAVSSGLNIDDEEFTSLLLDDTIEDDNSDEDIEETISIDTIIGDDKEESSNSLELNIERLNELKTPLIDNSEDLELEESLELDFELSDEVETPIKETIAESEDLELDLGLVDEVETSIKETSIKSEDIPKEIDINIDIEKTSSAIGVSIEDYNTFLNEYIDNALDLEEDIKGDDEAKHKSAIGTIAHLSEVLHIPLIGDIIDKIEPTPSDKQRNYIALFYDSLSRITTYENSPVEEILTPKVEDELLQDDESELLAELGIEEIEEELIKEDELLFFEETPKETPKEKVAPVEIETPLADEDILNIFDTAIEEEDTALVEIDTASDDNILDLFDTPVEEKKEVILKTASSDEVLDLFAKNSVESYDTPKVEAPIIEPIIKKIVPVVEKVVVKPKPEPIIQKVAPIIEEVVEVVVEKGFGTIDLSDIKPIHFDFQLEEAANDLSLPVELIEEFVNDFIDQAREETEKMLTCYEEGDLDAIQKIGHLLKGTSSNLRIKPLADTLYKIQFCEDSNHLEHFIKDYWGHFLSFEIQINAISH